MEHIVKKVIMASAGTGKTYRLSLEFISLLLKYKDYPEFDFSQIIVMTFTRKATAEIREKILDFLYTLANDEKESEIIIKNLKKISGYVWNESDRSYIKNHLLTEILQRKDLLQVSTIDSFTTNIFKSMIAPYLRIKDFSIDNNSNDEIVPLLLDYIFSQDVFPLFEPLLIRLKTRTVEGTQGFIRSLINNRWILDYYENGSMTGLFSQALNLDKKMLEELKERNWKIFKETYMGIVEEYNNLVYESENKPWHKHIRKDYKNMLHLDENLQISVTSVMETLLDNPQEVIRKIKVFFDTPMPFPKSRKKALKEVFEQFERQFLDLLPALADYYLIAELLTKEQEVLTGWKSLCQQYDKLKFSLGKFTYNDITFYSYKYLYEESLSLIDREEGIVTNLFYEQLVSRIRFLLIDEFQDTSFNQFSILMPIINELVSGYSVKDYSGVIIVGDPKQSIYGWRGGERGIMETMPKKLGVVAEDLSQCYRSTRPVIDMVNHIFTNEDFQNSFASDNQAWVYSPVTAKNWDENKQMYREDKEEGGELFYWEFNNQMQESQDSDEDSEANENDNITNSYALFAEQIKLLHQQGKITWGETAILVRTHTDADNITNELNKLNIPNNIESSGKLLEHKAVELLLTLLKFRLLKDRFSLLEILRSDLIMLDGNSLKDLLKIYHAQGYDLDKKTEFELIYNIPQVKSLFDFINKDYTCQSHFLREFIKNYDFSRICSNEIDWKNVYTFIELVISFELAKLNTSVFDLFSFLDYCQKQIKSDSEILQEGLQIEDSISILTVHKSKGLGFKNVFLYWKLSNKKAPNLGDEFKIVYSFDRQTYLNLTDFIIYSTSLDEKVLNLSNSNDLMQDYLDRNIIEAIDVFYVALTRAEQKLGLFFSYSSKSDFTNYLASLKNEAYIIGLLVIAYKEFFVKHDGENLSSDSLAYYHYLKESTLEKEETALTKQEPDHVNYLKNFLTDYSLPKFQENQHKENLKKIYLEDRHQLYGNVAHEFLTYITYVDKEDNCPDKAQFKMGKNMVYRKFGSLLSQKELEDVINSCLVFIQNNQQIFSQKWDKVFTEKTVFKNSQEYRIDRIMVNSNNKKIMIIDYKTGGINDENQVQHYIDIISDLAFVKAEGYEVKGLFLTIPISFT